MLTSDAVPPPFDRKRPYWRVLLEAWSVLRPNPRVFVAGLALMFVNRLSSLVLPASTKYLLDNIILKRQIQLLTLLLSALLVAILVQALTSFVVTKLLSNAAQRLITDLRMRVQNHLGRLPVPYYDINTTGALVSRIMSDIEGVRNLLGTGLVELVGSLVTAMFALLYLFRANPRMASAATLAFLIYGIAVTHAFKLLQPIYQERLKIYAEVSGRLTESISGVRVVKGYHAEPREANVFRTGAQKLLTSALRSLTATSLVNLSTTLWVGVINVGTMLLGTYEILSGRMTPGAFFSYIMFLNILIAPITQIATIGPQIAESLAGIDRTRELLDVHPEDADPRRTVSLKRVRGTVELQNVGFSYDAGAPVLKDISFTAQTGTVTALVGPSGAGKSTIIGLITAFYVPSSGRILVDGEDLADVKLDTWRTQLGVVLQDSFLFEGTIRDNVAFGRPGATDEEILAACRIARVDEFAERFEARYQTLVGERGVKLSGGEKQRVSIARAILADPRILILDEATSSLDSESEAFVQEGLRYLMRGRTTFVIAHRLSTIRRADQILVLDGGHIVARGTHEQLYIAGGLYHDLYTRQHGLESNLFLTGDEGSCNYHPLSRNRRSA